MSRPILIASTEEQRALIKMMYPSAIVVLNKKIPINEPFKKPQDYKRKSIIGGK